MAAEGTPLIVAGRRAEEIERIAADCRVRHGAETRAEVFDALDFATHGEFFERCTKAADAGLGGVVLCHGEMVDEDEARSEISSARRMIDVNFTSAVSLLERAASHLEARGSGFVCGITSVAGDRGRPSNYVYGATKAALSTYLGGLRARCAKRGVRVVDVKPGFVDTALTFGRPGTFLVASPEKVAADVLRAIRRNRPVAYTPGFWRLVMLIIRLLPDFVFKRLDL
jgi:short-subunit dehydrogenase